LHILHLGNSISRKHECQHGADEDEDDDDDDDDDDNADAAAVRPRYYLRLI
jgi:hypothetical protein